MRITRLSGPSVGDRYTAKDKERIIARCAESSANSAINAEKAKARIAATLESMTDPSFEDVMRAYKQALALFPVSIGGRFAAWAPTFPNHVSEVAAFARTFIR